MHLNNYKNVISNAHKLLDTIVTSFSLLLPIRLSGEGVSPVNICEYDITCIIWSVCDWGMGRWWVCMRH